MENIQKDSNIYKNIQTDRTYWRRLGNMPTDSRIENTYKSKETYTKLYKEIERIETSTAHAAPPGPRSAAPGGARHGRGSRSLLGAGSLADARL